MTRSSVRSVRSFCRICTSVCGIVVDVEGDRVIRVRGDDHHPFSRGYTCPKGRSLPELHHHPDRLEHPLVREGDRLVPTAWDACLDDLADRLRAVVAQHGPASVAVFFGSGLGMDAAGYRTAEALFRALGTPARFSPLTIDATAKTLVAHLMGGFPGLSAHADFEHARLVLFVGTNPVVSHGHNIGLTEPVTALRTMRTHGEVWVVDPRRTESARHATRHVAPRPGSDHAVLAYLVRELLAEGADPTVPAVGRDALAAAVEPYDLARTRAVADVPASDLVDLRDAVRRAGPVIVETGTGVTMAATADVTQWLAWTLMVLTGAMNRPGGVWFHPGFLRPIDRREIPVLAPDAVFGPGPASRPEARSFLGEWPCAALADEIEAGHIRAVLNLGGNLVTAFPDTNALVPLLESLEVLATVEIVTNETTARSTHVLPTADQLERPDVTLWDFLAPRIAVQHTPAVVEPVGDRRAAWWVVAELGRRLGHDLLGTGSGQPPTDDAMLARIMSGARGDYADLAASGWLEAPLEMPAPWVDAHIRALGGWRLAPDLLVEQLAALDADRTAAPMVLVPRRQARKLNAQLDHLGESPTVQVHPVDAAAAGIVDGGPVRVESARGELVGIARVDPAIRRGVVSVPHGHEHANVNRLTDKDRIDVTTGMVTYSGIPVAIGPA